MANKKFYYHEKKSDAAETDASREPRKSGDRRRGRQSGGRGNGRRPALSERIASRYPAEKLGMPLSGMGVSEELVGLLATNGIATAGDLACRTEREMFKVQGFNKKMLIVLSRALADMGMSFYVEESPAKDSAAKTKTERARVQAKASQEPRGERRRDRGKEERKPASRAGGKEKEEPRKKLAEPLPFPEWRKIQKNGKWGFYDGFNTVIPAMYDEVFFFKDGLAAVELDEKCGYITPDNEVAIPFEYETAMSFSEGLASVVKGGKCGYINKENEVVIPFVYDAATPFEEGEAKVKKDGRWGTIVPDGSVKWI